MMCDTAASWRLYLQLRIFCAVAAFLAMSSAAGARPDPALKPSGIVIHLFGPDSVPAAAADQEPSFGAILHQMFVTGDPTEKPGAAFPKGRASHE
jgi:hypothetical protein